MSKKTLPSNPQSNQNNLKEEIQKIQDELLAIQQKIQAFETVLRSHISDLIVEEQELFVLYKQIKKAKKQKRLAQKQRGKNYKQSKEVRVVAEQKTKGNPSEDQQQKKRLYREAILHIHPDKFSMDDKESDIATEVTTRLIEIYKNESLATLQAYHAHIFKGNTEINLSEVASKVRVFHKDNYLQQEKMRVEKEVSIAKEEQLYKVLTEYEDPLTFVYELKNYYNDRIVKLKKRTRKGL